MFYGNVQSISGICKEFIRNLDGILQNDFHLKSSFDKTKYIFDQCIWERTGHFDHWFSDTKAFLCSIWYLHREKLHPLGSSDLVLHSSINRSVVNGRDAMAAHSWDIYWFYFYLFYATSLWRLSLLILIHYIHCTLPSIELTSSILI